MLIISRKIKALDEKWYLRITYGYGSYMAHSAFYATSKQKKYIALKREGKK